MESPPWMVCSFARKSEAYFNARVAKMQCRPGRGTTALTAWMPVLVLDGRLNVRQMGNKPLINATRCAITDGMKPDCGFIITSLFDPLADRRERESCWCRDCLILVSGEAIANLFLPCDQLACPPPTLVNRSGLALNLAR